ncbi:MAG: Crp/Fnr family transcriptional regulator [Pseudorhizobium sp.]
MFETRNILLSKLSKNDAALIGAHLEPVTLKQGDVLLEPEEPIKHIYFFDDGLSSEIAMNDDGSQIEVGCIGREGFSGAPAVLGVDRSPHKSFMQSDAQALRITPSDLEDALDKGAILRKLLLRYVHVFMMQIAATALADGRYSIEMRLARCC